ncbi:MAG: hypothetical protein KC493_12030, partial [Bacteriovoracaceae bacterium]|nr:hypothetical protein [Bacteriovoracaceae bacterium]
TRGKCPIIRCVLFRSQQEESALLSDVCAAMAEKKIGSVLVMSGGKLAGIFTWIDALLYISKNK